MQRKKKLELLAPAKDKNIGIAAINCGADALYIAGPSFGAREAAGNSVEDIAELVDYAHLFGVRIYVTFNTLIFDQETEKAQQLIRELSATGCDALIIQDLGILRMDIPGIELHASTQTNIRTVEKAEWLASLGFSRLILARELSIAQIREIAGSVDQEIETFIHGALCVSYSGQCYISQKLCGRSGNRGSCIQACRALYDLIDEEGNVLIHDRPLLSLKDFRAGERIADLARAGVSSFKIEGRLKNESYIKNTVLYYRNLLDRFIEENPEYCRASFGRTDTNIHPNPEKTFNRGYTTFFLDGKRGRWLSEDAAKGKGEFIGTITSECMTDRFETRISYKEGKDNKLSKGDGVFIVYPDGESIGAGVNSFTLNTDRRSDRNTCHAKLNGVFRIPKGSRIYRNYDFSFEKELEEKTARYLSVTIDILKDNVFEATSEQGIKCSIRPEELGFQPETAQNAERAENTLRSQLSKKTSVFSFQAGRIESRPFLPVSAINAIRRELASRLETGIRSVNAPERNFRPAPAEDISPIGRENADYRDNIANRYSRQLYTEAGIRNLVPAFEIQEQKGAELMRTKYCLRYQTGLCLKNKDCRYRGNLYLANKGGYRLRLEFDCGKCEMVVKEG